VDASEHKALRCGQQVCWLRLVDELSGAALFSRVFAQGCWAEVGGVAVQAALRSAFARWGRPGSLRVDNGQPWVCPGSDLPSDLELWLAGLAMALLRNRRHRPQDNAKVERSQRTAAAWAEPQQCATADQLQGRLDEEDRIQREVYPFDGQHSRLEVFPELWHSGRPFAAGLWEALCWDWAAALRCLAAGVVQRRVDGDGYVSLYDHRHRVGRAFRGRAVQVRLDADSREWVFQEGSAEVGRSAAGYLTAENLCRLELRRRPGRSAQRTQQRRAGRAEGASGPGINSGPENSTAGGGGVGS
jgi:hypothetical protein